MILECVGFAFIVAQMTCTEVSPPPRAAVCPPVREWSQSFQSQIANEIEAAPGSALAQVAVETIQQRKIARACASAKRRR